MDILFITTRGDAILNCINGIRYGIQKFASTDVLIFEAKKDETRLDEFGRIINVCDDNQEAIKKKTFSKYLDAEGFFSDEKQIRLTRIVESVQQRNKYDVIVSCSGRFGIHDFQSHDDVARVAYLVDPFFYNQNFSNKTKRKRLDHEIKLVKTVDRVICTPQMFTEYKSCPEFQPYLNKYFSLEFPLVRNYVASSYVMYSFDKTKINLIYSGNFYHSIRSPRYLFSIMKKLDDNYKLYVIGSVSRRYKFFVNLSRRLRKRIHFLGHIEHDNMINLLGHADILLNIGNAIENQVPSKIFEYISLGKPIINISKIDNCLSRYYLRKYPIFLNICEKNSIDRSLIEFNKFACSVKRITTNLSFQDVEKKYAELSISVVGESFMKIISELLNVVE